MGFPVPAGAALVRSLPGGSIFEVAVVEHGGRHLVCKRLNLRMVDEPVARAALRREADLLGSVQHGSLPKLAGQGTDEWGPYLLESFQSGTPLRALAPAGREVLTRVLRPSFAALAELHGVADATGPLDVVHGDITPDHVLLDEGGAIRFVDFGQARWRGLSERIGQDDRGTVPYVAPELARGESSSNQAGDVYALAATLAYVVLGRDPCAAQAEAVRLVEIAEQGVDAQALWDHPQLSELEREVLIRALAFHPAERLREAAAVCAGLTAGAKPVAPDGATS